MRLRGWILAAIAIPAIGMAMGCHSYHIETTVENRTGAAIELLEVDYPSASFGSDRLAADGVYRYRIQLRGDGPLKVQYTGADGKPGAGYGTKHGGTPGRVAADCAVAGRKG